MRYRYCIIIALAIILSACKNNNNTNKTSDEQFRTFQNELFLLKYPSNFFFCETALDNTVHKIEIGKDSLDKDKTTIIWESPNTFPGNAEQYVTLFTGKEMEKYDKLNKLYDVIDIDSTYTIDGRNTYSIISLFTEDNDTIIQSRTGLIVPEKFDMMILQRTNTKKPETEVEKLTSIIKTIKIK